MDAEEMARNTTKVILGAANSADEETVAHIKQALARVPEGSMVSVPSEWPGDRYDDLIAASYSDDDAPKPEKPKEKNMSGKAPESEMKNDPIAKAEALLAKATIVETKMEEMSIEEKAMWWDSFYMEGKARHVRDAAFWGAPVGTLITPGMKPQGTGASRGRSRSSSAGQSSRPSMTSASSSSRSSRWSRSGVSRPVAKKPSAKPASEPSLVDRLLAVKPATQKRYLSQMSESELEVATDDLDVWIDEINENDPMMDSLQELQIAIDEQIAKSPIRQLSDEELGAQFDKLKNGSFRTAKQRLEFGRTRREIARRGLSGRRKIRESEYAELTSAVSSPKKPTTSTSGFDPATQSMLSPTDQKMPPANQISKLRRVAVRADKHAQWLEELIKRGSNRDNAKNRQAIEESYDRAKAATNEMLHVAKQSNDPRLTNSVRAQRPLRVKKPGGKTYPRR